jgi:dipeptidase
MTTMQKIRTIAGRPAGKTGLFETALIGLTLIFPAYRIYAQNDCGLTFDCFSIVVGRSASADGSVIVAHNEDTGTKLVNYYKVPAKDHQPGEEILFETGGKTKQVSHTLGYFWINLPVCDVCDTYINDSGVFVGSDGCPSREDKPEITNGGIVFWLRRIVAERARTAREGVEIAGKLIDEYGYASSGRTYIIADSRECWIMNVVKGKHWVAARLPDNAIAVIPNSFTIREVNLSDTANFMGSPDLVDYAIRRGWYDPATEGPFIFTKAYSNPGSLTHPDNINRMWRGTEILSGRKYDVKGVLPFSFESAKKTTCQDVMQVLRDHYEGTELDKSKLYAAGNPHRMNSGTICSGGSQYSTVALLRSWLPVDIGTLVWIAPFRPCTQAFTAWYPAITSIPDRYAQGDFESALKNHFDPAMSKGTDKRHAFRVFVSLVDAVDKDYGKFIPQVKEAWCSFEAKNFRDQERVEKEALEMYKIDPQKALKHLTGNTSAKAMEVYRMADKMRKQLN